MRKLILIATTLIICHACSKNESPVGDEFVGTYSFFGLHTHLIEFTDSVTTTFIEVTDTFEQPITISTIDKDSVSVEGLIKDGQNVRVDAIVEGENLVMNFNMEDTDVWVDELIGELKFNADSVFLEYRWRKGPTWQPAFPLYGNISASAKR